MLRFTAIVEDLESNLWGHGLRVPAPVSDALITDPRNRRVICTLNDQHSMHCALMPRGDGTYFIMLHKGLRKKLGLGAGTAVEVALQKDDSRYGCELPPEMEEVLFSDPEGEKLFHALTAGKQRSLLYMVSKVKSPDIRIRKALVIIEHLKRNGGRLDFRQLNEDMKSSNRPF